MSAYQSSGQGVVYQLKNVVEIRSCIMFARNHGQGVAFCATTACRFMLLLQYSMPYGEWWSWMLPRLSKIRVSSVITRIWLHHCLPLQVSTPSPVVVNVCYSHRESLPVSRPNLFGESSYKTEATSVRSDYIAMLGTNEKLFRVLP